MEDLEKRAEQIRKELSIDDKTNLVAKAIIELVKDRKTKIIYKEVSIKIQNMFGLKNEEPYIVRHRAMGNELYDIIKLCFDEKKEIPISILVDNGTKSSRDGFCDGYEKIYCKKYNLENLEKDQEETIKKICNGDYDFLLKPIPILDKIKVEKSIDEDIKNIEKAINHNDDIPEKDKKDTTEITIELRIHLGEMKDKVLNRANGECEYCKNKEMTFEKENGENYFEIHHIKHYSDCKREGIDPHTLDNLVALCPKCHKEIHFGKKDVIQEMEKELKEKVKKRNFN